jgi:hypothetical protein
MPSYVQFDVWQNTAGVTYNAPVQIVSTSSRVSFSIAAAVADANYRNSNTSITFTSKIANSKFLMMANQPGYCDGVNSGCALGFRFNGTLLVGVDYGAGANGNAWSMGGNTTSSPAAFNLNHSYMYSPNLPAGTSITVYIAVASWVGSHGNLYFNYNNSADGIASNYNVTSTLTVMEITQ